MARPSPRPDYNSDNFGQQAYAKKPRSAYRVGLVYLCFFAPCLFVLFFVTLAAFDFAVLVALVVFGVDATTGIARTVDAFRSVLPQTFALSTTESALTLFEKCLRLGCEWAGIARDGTANASVLDQWWTTSAPAMRGNLVRIASLLDGNRVSHDAAKAVTLQVSFSGIHLRITPRIVRPYASTRLEE